MVLLPGLFWARMPLLHILFTFFWKYFDRKSSELDPVLRSLVQVRVAQINWCKFCIDFNSVLLMERCDASDKIDQLSDWSKSELFSDLERAALEYTETLSSTEVEVDPALMARLKKHLGDDQIVELTALISFQNMSAKFNAALAIPSQGMCKIPPKN